MEPSVSGDSVVFPLSFACSPPPPPPYGVEPSLPLLILPLFPKNTYKHNLHFSTQHMIDATQVLRLLLGAFGCYQK